LSDRTFNVIGNMRNNDDNYFIRNDFSSKKYDATIFEEHKDMMKKLFESIDKGDKIVFCSNNLKEAELLQATFVDKYPNLKSLSYNSKTSTKDKKFALSNPDANMTVDLLIYTPTITAGISIETNHYD
jgi:hypothetical protein